jgi:hypothetical protein
LFFGEQRQENLVVDVDVFGFGAVGMHGVQNR